MGRQAVGRRLFRGYGPLVAVALSFTVMAAIIPTVGDQVRTVALPATTPRGSLGSGDAPPAAVGEATAVPTTGGAAVPADPSRSRATAGTRPAGSTATAPTGRSTARSPGGTPVERQAQAKDQGAQPAPGATGGVRPCPTGARQVPNDPYSPPCIEFSGNNGGATNRGVTAHRVVISLRLFDFPDMGDVEEGPAGALLFDEEELRDTFSALIDYFNSRFQFYGRRLEAVFWKGKSDIVAEYQGAGQEGAEADAIKASEEIKPFAEALSITTPYSDALARRQVVNLGAPYMSDGWYAERSPYSWNFTPDCTFVMDAVSDYLVKRVARRPAERAGGHLAGRPRSLALIAPENPWYQECLDAGDRALRAAGAPAALRLAYKLGINTASNQAASMVAKLRSNELTTVVCLCDPFIPLFLTSKAHEQSYEPEWIVTGVIGSDTDYLGQIYQQDQWAHAFGLSFSGASQPQRSTYGYFAYKSVRPDREPTEIVDFFYYHLYVLALGIQMAGPNLTPQTFEAGLRAYAGGSGPLGTWKFSPGRHTPTQDAREIYWDRERTSVVNRQPGSYVETEPGRRYRVGEW